MATETERKREIVVGLFALVAVAVAAFMVIRLGAEQRIFEPRFRLRAVFGNVSGLRGGAPVFIAGLNVGTVERLRFVAPGTGRRAEPERLGVPKPREDRVGEIEVVLNVEERFRPQIRLDSVASIGSVGLLGDKSIEISVGSASEAEIGHDAVLLTVDPLTLTDVVEQVEPMARKVDQILGDLAALTGEMTSEDSSFATSMNSLSHILQKVDRGEGSLGQLVNSPKTVEELDQLLSSASDAVAEIRTATTDLPPTMASIRKVAEEVATLSVSLRESAERLPQITNDIAAVTQNLKSASESFPSLSVQAEQGVNKATQVFDAAGRSILLRGYMEKPPNRLPVALGRTDASLESLRSGGQESPGAK